MGFEFSADEVFRIGEQIEINGERFYRAAAKSTDDPTLREQLEDLARQELDHQSRFRSLREQLGAKARDRHGWKFYTSGEPTSSVEQVDWLEIVS